MGFSFGSMFSESARMTGKLLESVLREVSENDVEAQGNVIHFTFQKVKLYCIYDETHDRMRFISAIKDYSEISEEEKDKMMESNFHSALDARYAMSDGVLYAAFMHPLSSLNKEQVLSGVYQVASLHLTFGDQYSSGVLSFG